MDHKTHCDISTENILQFRTRSAQRTGIEYKGTVYDLTEPEERWVQREADPNGGHWWEQVNPRLSTFLDFEWRPDVVDLTKE